MSFNNGLAWFSWRYTDSSTLSSSSGVRSPGYLLIRYPSYIGDVSNAKSGTYSNNLGSYAITVSVEKDDNIRVRFDEVDQINITITLFYKIIFTGINDNILYGGYRVGLMCKDFFSGNYFVNDTISGVRKIRRSSQEGDNMYVLSGTIGVSLTSSQGLDIYTIFEKVIGLYIDDNGSTSTPPDTSLYNKIYGEFFFTIGNQPLTSI